MKVVAAFMGWTAGAAAMVAVAQTNLPPTPPDFPRYQQVNNNVRLHDLSPVAYFRVLLGMKPAERERALAEKSPAEREAILRKITEYKALPPDVREVRLSQTQLRWAMTTLMQQPADRRGDLLRQISEAELPGVRERLKQWDQLPAEEQKAYLEKQSFLTLYLRWQSESSANQAALIDKLPPARRAAWTNELAGWQALPEGTRREMCDRFAQFFSMDNRQQESTVNALSDQERKAMEVSLRQFSQLPPEKRRYCVMAFGKFATMSPVEQNQFLRNAAHWEEMTPRERSLWRSLVKNLPPLPPMPPDFYKTSPQGLPPMPPGFGSTLAPKNAYAKEATN